MAAAVDAAADLQIREVEKASRDEKVACEQRLTAVEQQRLELMKQQQSGGAGAEAAAGGAAPAAVEVCVDMVHLSIEGGDGGAPLSMDCPLYNRKLQVAAIEKTLAAKRLSLVGINGCIPTTDEKGYTVQMYEPDSTVNIMAEPCAGAPAVRGAAATGLIDEFARLLRPMQQLVMAVYDNQHLPTQSQASSANQRLRHQVFAAYSANSDSGQESWCVVTGLWWPSLAREGCPYVRAAHIMGRATPAIDWAAMDLGPSPDVLPNVVPMMAGVEHAFDSYRMCAVPSRDAVTEGVSFEIHILDPALMTQPVYQDFAGRFKQDHKQWIHPSSRKQQRLGLGDLQAIELTFGQLHKQPLVFLQGQRPARRCFTYHAFWALRHAGVMGWDAGGLVIDENHFGWLSPTFESRLHATALWARMQSEQALGAGSDGVSSPADEEAAAAGHHYLGK